MIENKLENGKARLEGLVVNTNLFKYRMNRRQLMKVQ